MPESIPPQSQPYYPHEEEDELSLVDLWNIIWKRKWLWLTLGPLAAVIGVIVALNSTEIYKAEVLMAPANNEESGGGLAALAGQFGGLASMAGINIGEGGDTATALATLKSRQFINAFVTEENLLPVLFSEEWDPASKAWITENEEDTPTLWDAYKKFNDDILKTSEDNKTSLVTLAIEWDDPVLAEQWANKLSKRINQHLSTLAKAETEKNLAYLKESLEETRVIEIRESLYSLIQSQTQNAMLANATEEYAFKIIDPAVVPEERIRPRKGLIVVASGMLGGFLGIFLCFVFHFIDTAKRENAAKT